jgi:uncharacterized protein YegJ (DUF2314 family)
MSFRRAAPFLLLALLACNASASKPAADPSKEPKAEAVTEKQRSFPVLEGSLRIDARPIELAVYTKDPIAPPVAADAASRAKRRFADLTVRTTPEPSENGPSVLVFAPPIADLAPPNERQLTYFGRGLDDSQIPIAATSKGVLMMAWVLDDDPKLARLRNADALAHELATKQAGFVWDEITRELYTPQRWKEKRIDGWQGDLPDVQNHIVIHYYETDGGRHRAITLGMVKFGLPDLVFDDAPLREEREAGTLIDVVAQALVEGASVEHGELAVDLDALKHPAARARVGKAKAKGQDAKRKVRVQLVPVEREEGDPENRLVALRFPTYPGATDAERQAAALDSIFGSVPDSTVMESSDDPELAAVKKKVQARLPALATAFAKGLPLGQRISVKAPFDTKDGKREWMWVSVSEWKGNVIGGSLDNAPEIVMTLRLGSKVQVKQADVADYVLFDGKGELKEGGGSIEVLKKRHPEEN